MGKESVVISVTFINFVKLAMPPSESDMEAIIIMFPDFPDVSHVIRFEEAEKSCKIKRPPDVAFSISCS